MKRNQAFTLAEILITLSVVGIISAILIPSLLVNSNDKVFRAKRKALHARMAQAIGQIGDISAYEESTGGKDTGSAENFIRKGLNTVYKISSVCNKDNLEVCDIPDKIKNFKGENTKIGDYLTITKLSPYVKTAADWGGLDTEAAGFKTTNGESILLYYNPRCINKQDRSKITSFINVFIANEACVNILYDLNGGSKAPNELGKDIGFMTVLYPSNPYIAAPVPMKNILGSYALFGTNKDEDAAYQCKKAGDYILPAREDYMAMSINQAFMGNYITGIPKWTSTVTSYDESSQMAYKFGDGPDPVNAKTSEKYEVRCIEK